MSINLHQTEDYILETINKPQQDYGKHEIINTFQDRHCMMSSAK